VTVGGAELAVLVPDGERVDAKAETVLAAVHAGVDVGDLHLEPATHVGIAATSGERLSGAEVLARAEVALAAAVARRVPSTSYTSTVVTADGSRCTASCGAASPRASSGCTTSRRSRSRRGR